MFSACYVGLNLPVSREFYFKFIEILVFCCFSAAKCLVSFFLYLEQIEDLRERFDIRFDDQTLITKNWWATATLRLIPPKSFLILLPF